MQLCDGKSAWNLHDFKHPDLNLRHRLEENASLKLRCRQPGWMNSQNVRPLCVRSRGRLGEAELPVRPVRGCVGRLIVSRPRAGRLSSGGQTKASSLAAVPEASPLSIDPPSAQFLCDLWPCVIPIRAHTEALSRRDNGLVVTERGDGRAPASPPPHECKLMTPPIRRTSRWPPPDPPSSSPFVPRRPMRWVGGESENKIWLVSLKKNAWRRRWLIFTGYVWTV